MALATPLPRGGRLSRCLIFRARSRLVFRRVIWLSEAEMGKGFAVEFLDITLHAVSRDPEAYPSPCLYTQVIRDTSVP
jgi:hypothetical protein